MSRKLTVEDIKQYCKDMVEVYKRLYKAPNIPESTVAAKESYEDVLAYIERWM